MDALVATLLLLNLMLILTTLGLEKAKSFLSFCPNMVFFSRLVNLLYSRVVVAPVVVPVVAPEVTPVLTFLPFLLGSLVVVAPVFALAAFNFLSLYLILSRFILAIFVYYKAI